MSQNAPDPVLDPPEHEKYEVHAWLGGRLRLITGKGQTLESALADLVKKNGYAENE